MFRLLFIRFAPLWVVCILVISSALYAAVPNTQFVNIAPLPGAGIALAPDGSPDGSGAIQMNIPVAYTPGDGFVSVGTFRGNHIGTFHTKVLTFRDSFGTNGTSVIGMGFGHIPHAYLSIMSVSGVPFIDSKAVSIQVEALRETDQLPAISIGVQNALRKEHEDGSYYGVLTKKIEFCGRPLYVTGGYGKVRFQEHAFGGVSSSLSDQFSLSSEYDGFQFNHAIHWRPFGKTSRSTITFAYQDHSGITVGGSMTGKMNNIYAVPILFVQWAHLYR